MTEVTNFEEAQAALRQLYGKHAEGPYTLDRMFQLLAAVGNPQDQLQVVHVAGTSGKTSTAYYTASLLRAAGCKVGLTVSPHVDQLNERVQIDLVPLAETEFCRELSEFLGLVEASKLLPSYFECMVAFAYWEFVRRKVDFAVVEVGLGGLLDGTNTISRGDKVCVITDIGLDHTELLGDTIELIAAQKAGIIQPDNEVFMHQQGSEVMQVVRQACARQGAMLRVVDPPKSRSLYDLPLFQVRNFTLASAAASFVLGRAGKLPLNDAQLAEAAGIHIPARMEIIERDGKRIIIDGAHNAQKLETLFASIHDKFPDVPLVVLAGFAEGDRTRLAGALETIRRHAAQLIITSFYSEKDYPRASVPLADITTYAAQQGWPAVQAIESPAEAFAALTARPEPLLVVCGSFYLLNHIRPLVSEG